MRTALALILLSLTACSAQPTLLARAPLALQAQSIQPVRPLAVTSISAQEAHDWLSDPHSQWLVLDVRTPEEFAQGHLANATLKNFYDADFKAQLEQINRWQPTILYCRSGNRSAKTLTIMRELGFRNVYEVKGGIQAWQAAGFPLQS